MNDPFNLLAGWMHETLAIPLLYASGLMRWEELAFNWTLFAIYGVAQVALTLVICMPLERWRPVEHWSGRDAVGVDILYTLLSRIGILPFVTFVLFNHAQMAMNGWIADRGWIAPTLEVLVPAISAHPVLSFAVYAVILDAADYARHRLSHRFGWWWALHSVHHAQRQMTFWSDDRNHVLDDLIAFLWFGVIALLIGVPPLQFPLLVLMLRLIESLAHANARVSFGRFGGWLLISPRFHRAHHGVMAFGPRSCNYGAVLPWWDMLLGTARFSADYPATGDPSGEEDLASGSWWAQQRAGLRRMFSVRDRRAGRSAISILE